MVPSGRICKTDQVNAFSIIVENYMMLSPRTKLRVVDAGIM
jgi:hypothetical protein